MPWRIPHDVLCADEGGSLCSRIILVPPIEKCCGTRLQMDPRFSSPMVYTCNGTLVGAMFHGQCKACKRRYYYSFSEVFNGDGEVTRTYYKIRNEEQYFQSSSVTVFEKKLLIDITNNIVFSAATFESRSEVYDSNVKMTSSRQYDSTHHSVISDRIPTRRRIEDGWFLWAIVNTYDKLEMLEKTNLYAAYTEGGKRRDVESLCKSLWEEICSLRNKWVMHKCKVKGCAEGYVTVDGNEKLRRPMCAAPRSKIRIRSDLPTIVQCCTNYPVMGGKHQAASRYCSVHTGLVNTMSYDRGEPLPEHRNLDLQYTGVLPDNDDDSLMVGCKKADKRTKYYDTTAGMLALIRPCGIVVSMCEMFTCESSTQVYLFLLRTFVHDAHTVLRLCYLGYDRACDLKPYLEKQARQGGAGAKLLLDRVEFLVDAFHCKNHTEPCCMPPSNPECQFHPSLPKFREIHGANTESCEQGFRRLNKYKGSTRHMTQFKRNFFFYYVNNLYNEHLEGSLKLLK